MRDAQVVCKQMGITNKAHQRDRRPTMEELNTLMSFFEHRSAHRPNSCPMHVIVAFALFSTRRQSEITRITWEDYDQTDARVVVREMKHPGDKAGNDVFVELPDPCSAIVAALPARTGLIFPYTADAISAAFTRACKALGIQDLHFHDLRHEGTSRLEQVS